MQLAPGLMYVPGLTVQDALHVFFKKKRKKKCNNFTQTYQVMDDEHYFMLTLTLL